VINFIKETVYFHLGQTTAVGNPARRENLYLRHYTAPRTTLGSAGLITVEQRQLFSGCKVIRGKINFPCVFIARCLIKQRDNGTARPHYELGYVIPCAGNLTKEKSSELPNFPPPYDYRTRVEFRNIPMMTRRSASSDEDAAWFL
jgi:hypothetical protein